MRTLFYEMICSVVLTGLGLLCFAGSASAQSTDTEYCYGSVCGTQKDAEDAMKAAYPNYAPYFKQKDKSVGFVSGKLTTLHITYTVPDQPPATMNQPVYGLAAGSPAPQLCAASGDPLYPNSCASEQELVDGWLSHTQNSFPHLLVQ